MFCKHYKDRNATGVRDPWDNTDTPVTSVIRKQTLNIFAYRNVIT